ncbi:MAG TPA: hypothetical protein VE990_01645 [Acidimicrobiales bacterium]|nr:hypothetical protein [Acidimicrobiales bacterium]
MSEPKRLGLVAIGALAVALAACGGPSSPAVASLSSTTTAASGSAGGPAKPSLTEAQHFAACMRSHGVPGFPDPTPGPDGGFAFKIGPRQQGGTTASQMQAAQQSCRHLLPNNGVPRPLTAAQQQAFLDYAACIRGHGFPGFPDPTFSGGGVRVALPPGAGNPQTGPSPQFQAAQKACQSKLPGGFAQP